MHIGHSLLQSHWCCEPHSQTPPEHTFVWHHQLVPKNSFKCQSVTWTGGFSPQSRFQTSHKGLHSQSARELLPTASEIEARCCRCFPLQHISPAELPVSLPSLPVEVDDPAQRLHFTFLELRNEIKLNQILHENKPCVRDWTAACRGGLKSNSWNNKWCSHWCLDESLHWLLIGTQI